jgi:hypothetical protein
MAVPKGTRIGGRQKGTPNKATAEIRAAAQEYGPEALKTLVRLMRNTKDNPTAARAAAGEILDRAYGKAHQSISADIDAGITVEIVRFADDKNTK